ncbi:MAG TPA: Asp-tRNA(Asn)/Glu-tRNA(Gln) amidotransferase subunit GatA [Thermotogota bacterium]|nr:Asp-tRNA(Asn)/Glu-tRNA(Gln) amidotransferase subunit GatA [Thermotogota bacterium]
MHSLQSYRSALQEKRISAKELWDHYQKRVQLFDPNIGCFLETADLSPRFLEGTDGLFPCSVKDNIHVQGFHTTCGSQFLSEYSPVFEATVSQRLRKAGCVFVGKTNMDEFAMGSTGENSGFFPTRNPWDFERIPGGSSSGSAASVAAGFCLFSIGSDSGGSLRLPASFCGVVGYKPTYGLVPRSGLVSLCSSMDQVGSLTRCVWDAAEVSSWLIGKDGRDATTVDHEMDLLQRLEAPVSGLRLAFFREWFHSPVDPMIQQLFQAALHAFEAMGVTVVALSFPEIEQVLPVYYVLNPAEASSNLARFDGVRFGKRVGRGDYSDGVSSARSTLLGEEVQRRILLGTFCLESENVNEYFDKAARVRALLVQKVRGIFEEYDGLVSPTAPCFPPKLGESLSPLEQYQLDRFTALANLGGFPAISIPLGFSDGLPTGLHLCADRFQDAKLLQLARSFEKKNGLLFAGHYPFPHLEDRP